MIVAAKSKCYHASTSQFHPALIIGLKNPLYHRWRPERTQDSEQRTPKNLCVLQAGIRITRSAILQEQESTPECAVLAQGDRDAEIRS